MQTGIFYKIGNNTFNVVTYGNGPNVIFESGLDDSLLVWEKVAPSQDTQGSSRPKSRVKLFRDLFNKTT